MTYPKDSFEDTPFLLFYSPHYPLKYHTPAKVQEDVSTIMISCKKAHTFHSSLKRNVSYSPGMYISTQTLGFCNTDTIQVLTAIPCQ